MMTTLSVVGSEDGQLILVSADGERFVVPITDALLSAVRQVPQTPAQVHRASPKDIQAHIRRGLSAQQVADLTGEEVSYIERFEGTVIAEREFMIDQALSVAVSTKAGAETTFGRSVRSRLADIKAHEQHWTAWKEELGWIVQLLFTEGDVEHTARWEFDPRKHLLKPGNDDAAVLSRHEPMPTTLIPKLSAVSDTGGPDRFDSEIFETSDLGETGPLLDPVPYGRQGENSDGRLADTADLLEVLRRKRGERERLPEAEDSRHVHPATGGIHIVEDNHEASVTPISGSVPYGSAPETDEDDDPDDDPKPPTGQRKDRPGMPTWDDIVFGARGDDDPV
jgi:hypothetical protein